MYYEYWGLNRPPFDNVPDPSMYFSAHQTTEQAVGEVLFAIEEGDECLAVIVGEVGLGKTTTLRVILDTLDHEKYRIAFVTNPDVTFTMLLREIVGQLHGEHCHIRRKDELLEEFNKLLFTTADEGKRVLIFIDEGNAFKPVNLESMRLLTNMQEDDRNLFTIVLAGQPKLAKMLEAPSRANLFQRIGVYCHLEKIESWLLVRDYIDHRLERAGRSEAIFTDDAVKAIFEYSENGVPRLVNKLAKLALKAGETNGAGKIGAEVVEAIGLRFTRFTRKDAGKTADDKDTSTQTAASTEAEEEPSHEYERAPMETVIDTAVSAADTCEPAADAASSDVPPLEWPAGTPGSQDYWAQEQANADAAGDQGEDQREDQGDASDSSGDELPSLQVCLDEALRPDVVQEAHEIDEKKQMKLAGQLAAEGIKNHPEYISQNGDPVTAWQELRNEILSAFSER